MTHQGLLDPITPEIHGAACRYRLSRVGEALLRERCDAILLTDPINIRYATDTSNMQVWTLHNAARYALVFANGKVVLFEFHNCDHLHAGNELVDEVRAAVATSYLATGERRQEKLREWAADIGRVLADETGGPPRLAVDHADFEAASALRECGITLTGGEGLMERARAVKSPEEITHLRWSLRVCEAAVERMHDELRPGMREIELWAYLHLVNVRHNGEWIETRLLCSGPRTNPWMREAGMRRMGEGELVCFDTDMIGPYGYCADVSRAWSVGHLPPTPAQRELYQLAYEQIHTNMGLLRAGVSAREVSEKAWPIPTRYYRNRYSYLMHGVGLGDEYPGIAHAGEDWSRGGYDAVLESDMVLCVESFIGDEAGGEGVKLEQPVRITDSGVEALCAVPWNDDWL